MSGPGSGRGWGSAGSPRTSIFYELRAAAYRLLDLTDERVRAVPQITSELSTIATTLRRAGQPKVTRRVISPNNPHGVEIVEDTRHVVPWGPGCDLPREWPTYLESSDHADARKVLLVYESIPRKLRRTVPVEAFCVAASVSPLSILSILVGEIVRRGTTSRNVIAMLNQPRVVQKSVDMALTDEGFADRALLARATGFLPAAKGAQTIVNVAANASATADAKSIAAAPPEQTIRRLVDRFNDVQRSLESVPAAPALPAASSLVPSSLPAARPPDVVTLDVPLYDDDEEDDET